MKVVRHQSLPLEDYIYLVEATGKDTALVVAKDEKLLPEVKYNSNGVDVKFAGSYSRTLVVNSKGKEKVVQKDKITIELNKAYKLPLGIKIYSPTHTFLFPRSGLFRNGWIFLNAVGLIDADFRGEVSALVGTIFNRVEKVRLGDRIAQLVFPESIQKVYLVVDKLLFENFSNVFPSDRGEKGFGSSGRQ